VGRNDPHLRLLVELVSREDHRIRYLYLARSLGLSRARNAGIAASRGEVIAMTDDDREADREEIGCRSPSTLCENLVYPGLIGGR